MKAVQTDPIAVEVEVGSVDGDDLSPGSRSSRISISRSITKLFVAAEGLSALFVTHVWSD